MAGLQVVFALATPRIALAAGEAAAGPLGVDARAVQNPGGRGGTAGVCAAWLPEQGAGACVPGAGGVDVSRAARVLNLHRNALIRVMKS